MGGRTALGAELLPQEFEASSGIRNTSTWLVNVSVSFLRGASQTSRDENGVWRSWNFVDGRWVEPIESADLGLEWSFEFQTWRVTE